MIFLTNGNMPLNAAYADEIVQEENSTYQLSFRFPTSDPLWEKLKEETFLTADDLHGEQDFVIFEVEKKHGYIQVYANQVFTLLNNYVVNPISLDRQTGSTALSRFAGSITRDNPFSFFSDIEDRHSFNIGSKNAMEAFAKDKHSIIGQWGGDLVRHGYQVRLLKNGGSENESLFMYKKNLSSYQHKTSTKSLKTRITFIATVKGEGEKAPDRTFTVTIDSPLINKYSQIYEDVIEVNDQDVKDEASLRKYGEQYFRTSLCDMMEDSLELDVVGQSDVPVQMYDIVSLFHEVYNLDVRKKITKYTYSPMAKKLKSIGFGQFQSGLANAIGNAVSDAVKGEAQQLQGIFEWQLARELKNADLAFDRQKKELVDQFLDEVNAAHARAEEVKRELSDTIDQRFSSFDNGPLQEIKRKAIEALQNAGASSLLAQEAKRIGLDSIARLEAFKSQATSAQTALSGDLDTLKRTVTSEVNQASEYRRTTTEVLSRMTGQMNGFATKSEVKQGIDGLTQTFAKMKVGGRNLIRNYDWDKWLPLSSFSVGWKFERVEDQLAKSGYMLKATCTKAGNGGFYKTLFDLRSDEFQGKDMTWSWDMKSSRPITFYDMGFEAGGLKRNVPVSTEWTRITNTFQVAFNRFYSCVFYANGWEVGDVVYIRDPQLEEGTVATTPRPAPEDGEDEILAARTEFKQTADRLSTRMATVENYVNQDGQRQEVLRRYTREESARQANAVRELVTMGYVGKATHQEDVRGLERKFEAITNPQSGLIATQIATYKNAVDGRFADIASLISGKASQVDFQRVQETSKLYERIIGSNENDISNKVARMALTNQLFQVEVGKVTRGGRNLIRNYDWNGLLPLQKLGTDWKFERIADKNAKSGYVLKATCTQGGAGGFYKTLFDLRSDEFQGKDMTSSWDMKASRSITFNVMGFEAGGLKRNVPVSTEWTRITNTFKVAFKELFSCVFYSFEWKVGDVVYIRDPQLEEGPIATSPKRSLEDTEEAVHSVQSQLAGSWAVQNINNAGDLISGINLGANGHNRFDGKLTHITGETLIDKAVIKSAMIDKLKTANFEAGSVTTVILDAEAVTAEKLKVDQAFFNKLVANEAYLSQLFAKQAFINRVQSVAIDASQVRSGILSGDRIYGGTIRGASIYGGTLTGHTQIQLGSYGSFDTVNGGLQINVPRTVNAKDGLGVQFIGSYGRGENVPYGLFIYKDSDFTVGGTAETSDDFLLTVEGYINAKGIGWLKTGKGSVNGKTTGTIGLWNSDNVSLSFGGSGNDIYYSYNGTAYSLWSVVNQHFSDRRLKENIIDCEHKALDYIQQFRFKEYDWRKQEDRPQQVHTNIGLIAQEVQEVDPTLVYENGDTMNLDNLRLTNIALKAIQELALENQKLTHRLENLENEYRTA